MVSAMLAGPRMGIKWRDAKIQSITFELAKLKAWRFGAKTERMNAQDRVWGDLLLRLDDAPCIVGPKGCGST